MLAGRALEKRDVFAREENLRRREEAAVAVQLAWRRRTMRVYLMRRFEVCTASIDGRGFHVLTLSVTGRTRQNQERLLAYAELVPARG